LTHSLVTAGGGRMQWCGLGGHVGRCTGCISFIVCHTPCLGEVPVGDMSGGGGV
jgi:hypothetical protein